jgi:hypothetical protein
MHKRYQQQAFRSTISCPQWVVTSLHPVMVRMRPRIDAMRSWGGVATVPHQSYIYVEQIRDIRFSTSTTQCSNECGVSSGEEAVVELWRERQDGGMSREGPISGTAVPLTFNVRSHGSRQTTHHDSQLYLIPSFLPLSVVLTSCFSYSVASSFPRRSFTALQAWLRAMASPMIESRIEPHKKAHFSLHVSDRIADSDSSHGSYSSVKCTAALSSQLLSDSSPCSRQPQACANLRISNNEAHVHGLQQLRSQSRRQEQLRQ